MKRFWSVLLAAGLLAGCPLKKDGPPLKTALVQPSVLRVQIDELGIVQSTEEITVPAPFRGRIIWIRESGAMVEKGEVVARIDTRSIVDDLNKHLESLKGAKADLERAIDQLEMEQRSNILDVSSAQAQLDLARVQLSEVNRDLAELEYLREREVVPQEDVRRASTDLNITEIDTYSRDMDFQSQITGARTTELSSRVSLEQYGLQGDQALRKLRETQDKLDQAELTAPTGGMFLRDSRWNWQMNRNVERQSGEEVSSGEKVGKVSNLEALVIQSQIPEGELHRVRPGMKVLLVFDAISGLQLPGTIRTISPVAIERAQSAGGLAGGTSDKLTGEKVFEMSVSLDDFDNRLRPGLSAQVKILVDQKEGVLTVPLEAIETRNGRHIVRVASGTKHEEREVEIGQMAASRVEILSGLEKGEEVLLEGW